LIQLLVLHAVLAALAPALQRTMGARVFLVSALAPLATVVWMLLQVSTVSSGGVVEQSVAWVPQLGLELTFRLDALAVLMVGMVSGIGVLVFWYATWYFARSDRAKLGAFACQLTAFAGAMLGLVTADNMFALFVFWELTAITSYLLIGYDDRAESARAAAQQALLVTGAGGLALLAGIILPGQAAGTTSMHAIVAAPPAGTTVTVALVLVVIAAATKSAQVPFHAWLPKAMAAPTPVSAYLHSATMVTAGVYLVARLSPAFADHAVWTPTVVVVGLITMLVGAARALRQDDLKLLLAFGTVSQLGLMFALFGLGERPAALAGAALLVAHALYKAALFMTVGIVDHAAGTREIHRLSGIRGQLPVLAAAAAVATVSMVGLPPTLGFIAKEAAYDAVLESPIAATWRVVMMAALVVGSALTLAYGWRFLRGGFGTRPEAPPNTVHRPATMLLAPVLVLASLTAATALHPGVLRVPVVVGTALEGAVDHADLALWHGVNAALAWSGVAVALGLILVWRARDIDRGLDALPAPAIADRVYQRTMAGVVWFADRVTGVMQNGSLPTYLSVIAATVVIVPGVELLRVAALPSDFRFAESAIQVVVVAVLGLGAIAATFAHRRFVAVLMLGAVGYAVAALFVIQGGPDLALTQLLVETLTVVVFVLVLRHIPERFRVPANRRTTVLRATIAIGVGGFASLFTLGAIAARRSEPVSGELAERAVPDGGGRNVVNVILTDFRALDTLGEISVLVVAALGVVSLLFAGRAGSSTLRSSTAATASDSVSESAS
jgi:multicomponent Na+:H+ antiporter subunit A